MGTPQSPATGQPPSAPQQPAPPSARQSAPPPADVNGPRPAPAAPRQTVPPVDVHGPRPEGPAPQGKTPSVDVSGPPQTPSSSRPAPQPAEASGAQQAPAGQHTPADASGPEPKPAEAAQPPRAPEAGKPADTTAPRTDQQPESWRNDFEPTRSDSPEVSPSPKATEPSDRLDDFEPTSSKSPEPADSASGADSSDALDDFEPTPPKSSGQQEDLGIETDAPSPGESTKPAPKWWDADGGSPFDAKPDPSAPEKPAAPASKWDANGESPFDPKPDPSAPKQSGTDAPVQDVDGERPHHDPESSDHVADPDERDQSLLTTELSSGDEPYFPPDYVANPDFRATEQDAEYMKYMYPEGEWSKDAAGFQTIVDSRPELKAIGFDQAMGVRGYTAWHSYGPINQALREGDVNALQHFDGHIRCAVSALNQLPPVELPDNQVFHRVMMGGDIDKIVGQYAEGEVTVEHGFTSVSQGEPLLEPGKGTDVHMEIEGHSFRDVSYFAKRASENEAIAPPGIALLCTEKRYDEELGCWKLKFKEVEVPRNPDGSLTQRPKVLTTPEESAMAAKIDMMTVFG